MALHVTPETGLSPVEVDAPRKEHGYNEVAETKGHPVLAFLGKFWGLSAWMLEVIMVLSAVLRKFPDLAVVNTLMMKWCVPNAGLNRNASDFDRSR